jgi:hypothetical protein
METDIQELRDILECPVCLTYAVKGPIKGCKNGHNICNFCQPKLTKNVCPTCRENIDVRSLQLEKMRQLISFPCQFVSNGCQIEMKLNQLETHYQECNYADLYCPLFDCDAKIANCKFLEHCKSHLFLIDNCTNKSCVQLSICIPKKLDKECSLIPKQIMYKNATFFLKMSRNNHGFWMIWLYFAGFATEATHYSCLIQAQNDRNNYTYEGNVIPLTIDESTVLKNGIGLILNDPIIQQIGTNHSLLLNTITENYISVSFIVSIKEKS